MQKLVLPILAIFVFFTAAFADTFRDWKSEEGGGTNQTLTITAGEDEKITIHDDATVTLCAPNDKGEMEEVKLEVHISPTQGKAADKITITSKEGSENSFPTGTVVKISRIDSSGGTRPKGNWGA